MKLPNLSPPVQRNINTDIPTTGIDPSGIACNICRAACNRLPSFPSFIRRACRAACNRTVCRL